MFDNENTFKNNKSSKSQSNIDDIILSPLKYSYQYIDEDKDSELSKTDSLGQQFHKASNSRMRSNYSEVNNDLNDNGNYVNCITNSITTNPKQMYQEKATKEHILDRKIRDVNLQINKLKDENIKVSKLREDYEKLTSKLQKDIKDFNMKKELEKEQLINWKNEEMKLINKERSELGKEQKQLLSNKSKLSSSPNNNELIESFKVRINVLQDKAKQDKLVIDSLKKEIEFLYCNKLKTPPQSQFIFTQPETKLKPAFKQYDESELYGSNVLFDFKINEQYLITSELVKEEKIDNKTIRTFACGKYEIVFQSGIKRIVYKDGHQIIYFPNGDINQIYLTGKEVFLFKENETIQTKFLDGTIVLKFKNDQIEKHFPNKTKEIIFKDGTVTYVTDEGYEETYFINEDIRITNRKENKLILFKREWRMEVSKLS